MIERFTKNAKTTKDDTLIILGDAGINYYADFSDVSLKQKLHEMPISFFCIHGNHEIRPANIQTYTRTLRYGGLGWCEPQFPSLFFAMDGEVFRFHDKTCLVIGGAYSVDKYFRLSTGKRWFADEQPDDATKRYVEDAVKLFDDRFDFVFTHTCPYKYIPTEMFLPGIDQSTVDDSTERWLDAIEDGLDYDHWLCGHYHVDKTVEKLHFMYNNIVELEDL